MRFSLIFILSFIIYSCVKNKTPASNIDLFSKPISQFSKLSEVATDIKYVPLQTTDSSIISRIYKLKVACDFYYIGTLDGVLCFDQFGKFISKLDKKGRGPEEYESVSDFDVSRDNKFLILKTGKSLVEYDIKNPGFSFVRKIPFSQPPSHISFTKSDNNILLQYSNEDGTKPYSRILINLKGDTLELRPNYLKYTLKDGWISYSIYENINYWYNNDLYSKEMQNDTIFCFDVASFLKPKYIFNSQGKGLTPEARSNGLYFCNHGDEYIQVQKIFESDQFIFYSSYYSKIEGSFIIEKQNGKKHYIDNKSWLMDDLAGGVNFESKYCNNGIFYSWVEAFKLKESLSGRGSNNENAIYQKRNNALLKLAGKLDENDNPVLIIVKMK